MTDLGSRPRRLAAIATVLALLVGAPSPALRLPLGPGAVDGSTPITMAYLDAQPYSWEGTGQVWVFTASDAEIRGYVDAVDQIHVGVVGAGSPSVGFGLRLATPSGVPFGPGRYENAQRFRGSTASMDGLGGCNVVTGWFEVHEYEPAADGSIARLSLTAEHHCEGGMRAEFVEVRIASSVPVVAVTTSGPATLDPVTRRAEVTVTNHGTVDSPVAAFVAGRDAGEFAIVDPCPATLPPGESCAIAVAGSPRGPGSRLAEIVIDDGTLRGRRAVPLEQDGIPGPELALTVSSARVAAGSPISVFVAGAPAGSVVEIVDRGVVVRSTAADAEPTIVTVSLASGEHWLAARTSGPEGVGPGRSAALRVVVLP